MTKALLQPMLWRQYILQLPLEERWLRCYLRAVSNGDRFRARQWRRIITAGQDLSPTGPKIKLTRGDNVPA